MLRFPLSVAATAVALALASGPGAQSTSMSGTSSPDTTSTAEPPCASPASLEFWAVNESGQSSVTLHVFGNLDPTTPAPCAPGPGSTASYDGTITCAGTGLVQCTDENGEPARIAHRQPGAWIHRIQVQVPAAPGAPANDVQQQAQRAIVVAPSPTHAAGNSVVWTVYGFARAVTTASGGTLRTALDAAGGWTATHPGRHALVTLQPPGPIRLDETSCALADEACGAPTPEAGLCLDGDRIVLDGRDDQGRRAAELDVGTFAMPVVRVYGRDVELRGLVLRGTQSTDVTAQADTIDFMRTAQRSTLVDATVLGPSAGDAVGACGGGGADADANVVADSEIRGAHDKGVKAIYGAVQAVTGSCVADNMNGGIQATLGGRIIARENVVQHNVPNSAENGISANDNVDVASSVTTRGNIVRFAGGRGLTVVDNAVGDFHDDYVARNQNAGAKVETTRQDAAPQAAFSGVALVCNKTFVSGTCASPVDIHCLDTSDCDPGASCKETFPAGIGLTVAFGQNTAEMTSCLCEASPCPCTVPLVTLGDGTAARPEIALTLNRRTQGGANLKLDVPDTMLPAGGTQWEGCTAGTCDEDAVRQANVLEAPEAGVGLLPLMPAAGREPTLTAVSSPRPHAGDIVRLYGTGFDAIDGNALSLACRNAPDRGLDFCDPSDPELAQVNHGVAGNRLRLVIPSPPDAGQSWPLDLVAVTPTMLAFRMPVDCFAPGTIEL